MTGLEALNEICAECQKDKGKIQVACPWRSISGDYCEEYETIKRCIERLAELEDKIEDGRLKELPGDTVYEVFKDHIPPFIQETTIDKIIVTKKGLRLKLARNSFYETAVSSIGKTIFFSKAEAEKKLKELKGE